MREVKKTNGVRKGEKGKCKATGREKKGNNGKMRDLGMGDKCMKEVR